jgi:hypothetical protein
LTQIPLSVIGSPPLDETEPPMWLNDNITDAAVVVTVGLVVPPPFFSEDAVADS